MRKWMLAIMLAMIPLGIARAYTEDTWMRSYIDAAYVYEEGGRTHLLVYGWGFSCDDSGGIGLYVNQVLAAAPPRLGNYARSDVYSAFFDAGWRCQWTPDGATLGKQALIDITDLPLGTHQINFIQWRWAGPNGTVLQMSDGVQTFIR